MLLNNINMPSTNTFRNKTTKLIREAKSAFYSSQIRLNLHKPLNLSRILRNLTGIDGSTQNIEGLNTDNTLLQDDLEIANALNKHFTNIVDKYSDFQDMSSTSWAPNLKLLEFYWNESTSETFFTSPPHLRNICNQLPGQT